MRREQRLTLTPELAEKFLARRWEGQRPLKEPIVQRIQRDIEAGVYFYNPFHPLGFDVRGRLADGQHTCEAVRRSGVAVEVDVIYDVPDELLPKLGAGVGWTLAERLAIADLELCEPLQNGAKRAALVQTIAGIYMHLHSGSQVTPTDTEALKVGAFYAKSLAWWAQYVSIKLFRSRNIGAAFVMAHQVRPGTIEQFVPKVYSGAGLQRAEPALTLRDYLQVRVTQNKKDTQSDVFKKTLRACQAYVEGEPLHKLIAKDGQRDAVEFWVGKVGHLREKIGVGRATRNFAGAERRYVISDGEKVTIEAKPR